MTYACENSWTPSDPDVEVGPSLGICGLFKPCEKVSKFAPIGSRRVRTRILQFLRGARCHQYCVTIVTPRVGLLGLNCWFVKPLFTRL